MTSVSTNEPTRVYTLNGIRLLPHFLQKDTYVVPGSAKTFTSEELIKMGATPIWHNLWPRANLPKEEAEAELTKMRTPILIKKKVDIQNAVSV